MNQTHRLKTLALPALLLTATSAIAATDGDAFHACSRKIAMTIEETQNANLKLTVDESGIDPGQPLVYRTTFEIDALDPSSERVIGKFSCQVNRRAEVMSLRTLR